MPILLLMFHMDIRYEHSFQCVNITWHFNTRNNVISWMFNTLAMGLDDSQEAHNTQFHFTDAVQRFNRVLLVRNYNVYVLLACWLCPKSKHHTTRRWEQPVSLSAEQSTNVMEALNGLPCVCSCIWYTHATKSAVVSETIFALCGYYVY
jgi:hypothetical protein